MKLWHAQDALRSTIDHSFISPRPQAGHRWPPPDAAAAKPSALSQAKRSSGGPERDALCVFCGGFQDKCMEGPSQGLLRVQAKSCGVSSKSKKLQARSSVVGPASLCNILRKHTSKCKVFYRKGLQGASRRRALNYNHFPRASAISRRCRSSEAASNWHRRSRRSRLTQTPWLRARDSAFLRARGSAMRRAKGEKPTRAGQRD